MQITVSGHQEKIVKDLRAAADAVLSGKTGYIDIEADDESVPTEIQFTADNSEFGLEDKMYGESI